MMKQIDYQTAIQQMRDTMPDYQGSFAQQFNDATERAFEQIMAQRYPQKETVNVNFQINGKSVKDSAVKELLAMLTSKK